MPHSNSLEIRLQTYMADCAVCQAPTEPRWGLPTCNGDIVSVNFPDDLWSGSILCCERCYLQHQRGGMVTYDHYYLRRCRGPLGVDLIQGAGI
jgi:hypothetical protein